MDPDSPPRRVHRTRRLLLELLQDAGSADVATLAARLGLTGMAVRQQLQGLAAEGLVRAETRRGGVGRPAQFWRLTPAAGSHFADGHAGLAVDLLGLLEEALGGKGLQKLLRRRAKRQAADWGPALAAPRPLPDRVAALAARRSAEGYAAKAEAQPDGSLRLTQRHCPIAAAACACPGLCEAELALYRKLLGREVSVERVEHRLAGASACSFRIAAAGG